VKITADTITDEQIETLIHDVIEDGSGFVVNDEYVPTSLVIQYRDEALEESEAMKAAQRRARIKARAFFAEILNTRSVK